MNIEQLCHLLLNTDQLLIRNIRLDEGRIRLSVESTTHSAICLSCGQMSTDIHSHYLRYPTDLAWAEWPAVIHLRVKRFFCRNKASPKRTFAERFPEFVASYARRTQRVNGKQQQIGLNLSSRIAEDLLRLDQIGISDTTINRLIRALPEPENAAIRVLDVDDWAERKGQLYGTILVDLERGSVVDLLQDRSADTLAQWLKGHPGIEVVSRDRSQTYVGGIQRGAPRLIDGSIVLISDEEKQITGKLRPVLILLSRELDWTFHSETSSFGRQDDPDPIGHPDLRFSRRDKDHNQYDYDIECKLVRVNRSYSETDYCYHYVKKGILRYYDGIYAQSHPPMGTMLGYLQEGEFLSLTEIINQKVKYQRESGYSGLNDVRFYGKVNEGEVSNLSQLLECQDKKFTLFHLWADLRTA